MLKQLTRRKHRHRAVLHSVKKFSELIIQKCIIFLHNYNAQIQRQQLGVFIRGNEINKAFQSPILLYRLQTQGYQKPEQERALAACWKTRVEPHR